MAFLGFGKKKMIPTELPDLISDEIEKESLNEINSALRSESETKGQKLEAFNENIEIDKLEKNKREIKSKEENEEPLVKMRKLTTEEINRNRQVVDKLVKGVEETKDRPQKSSSQLNKSFFSELQENLMNKGDDLDSLENWYNNKFKSREVLDDMKSYWDNQKKISVLDELGKNYQKKITEKIDILQKAEKEWQEIYFEMVDKEEKIKDYEKELKELLSEFMKVCKDKKEKLINFDETQSNKKNVKQNNINGGEKKDEEESEKISQKETKA